jgi:hypothetical protein
MTLISPFVGYLIIALRELFGKEFGMLFQIAGGMRRSDVIKAIFSPFRYRD